MPRKYEIKAKGAAGELVRDMEVLRMHFCFSVEEMAARLGVCQSTYVNWLTGKNAPPFSVVDKLARLCKINSNKLYCGMHAEILKVL